MKSYLIDTHTLIWYLNGDAQLSENAKQALMNKSARRIVSIATIWEIAIKINIGKLFVHLPMSELPVFFKVNGFEFLPLSFEHCEQYQSLPLHHRDPFDRILIVQAQVENLTIVSRDPNFPIYGVPVLW